MTMEHKIRFSCKMFYVYFSLVVHLLIFQQWKCFRTTYYNMINLLSISITSHCTHYNPYHQNLIIFYQLLRLVSVFKYITSTFLKTNIICIEILNTYLCILISPIWIQIVTYFKSNMQRQILIDIFTWVSLGQNVDTCAILSDHFTKHFVLCKPCE